MNTRRVTRSAPIVAPVVPVAKKTVAKKTVVANTVVAKKTIKEPLIEVATRRSKRIASKIEPKPEEPKPEMPKSLETSNKLFMDRLFANAFGRKEKKREEERKKERETDPDENNVPEQIRKYKDTPRQVKDGRLVNPDVDMCYFHHLAKYVPPLFNIPSEFSKRQFPKIRKLYYYITRLIVLKKDTERWPRDHREYRHEAYSLVCDIMRHLEAVFKINKTDKELLYLVKTEIPRAMMDLAITFEQIEIHYTRNAKTSPDLWTMAFKKYQEMIESELE